MHTIRVKVETVAWQDRFVQCIINALHDGNSPTRPNKRIQADKVIYSVNELVLMQFPTVENLKGAIDQIKSV